MIKLRHKIQIIALVTVFLLAVAGNSRAQFADCSTGLLILTMRLKRQTSKAVGCF